MTSNLLAHAAKSVALAVIVSLSFGAQAAVYYVNGSSGNDANSGSAPSPWRSVNKALSSAQGGDVVVFSSGDYGDITLNGSTDVFSSWTTFQAAYGADVNFGSFTVRSGTKALNLIFQGINFTNGINVWNSENLVIEDAVIEIQPPWTGSFDNIEKSNVFLRASSNIVLDRLDITRGALGITLYQTADVTVRNSRIHDLTHDGIRVVSTNNTLIENNHIWGLNDGVTDAEATWSRHCDAIHIYIGGAGSYDALIPNDGVIVRGNILHDVEAQLIQFNNYGNYGPEKWNQNILFEHNIFGPSVNPMAFNNASPVDGLVLRHNIFYNYDSTYTTPYGEVLTNDIFSTNSNMRAVQDTLDLQIYNNIFYTTPIIDANADIVDYNINQQLPNNTALSRNTRVILTENLFNTVPTLMNETLDGFAVSYRSGITRNGAALDPDSSVGGNPQIGPYRPLPGLSVGSRSLTEFVRDSINNVKATLAANSAPVQSADVTIFFDDFEDADFECDPYLVQNNRYCIKWSDQPSYESQFELAYYTNSQRNMMHTPVTPDSLVNKRIVENAPDWSNYFIRFDAMSTYVRNDSGVIFNYVDDSNYYFLDIGTSAGRLVRVINGIDVVLAQSGSIALNSQKEMQSFSISVTNTGESIDISIDSNSDGTADLEYSDTAVNALNILAQGKVGVLHVTEDQYYRIDYDNFTVSQVLQTVPEPPTITGIQLL